MSSRAAFPSSHTPLGPSGVVADDATLVAQALGGNERAFTALYRRYARYVAGVAYRILGTDAELDDVVQEAFCDASSALATLKEGDSFRPWLARITVHRIHKRLAKRRRWRWLVGEIQIVAPQVSDPRERARVDALYEQLEALAPDIRVPWMLHFIEGETLPDVAKICDVSLATAKRRIAKAQARIDGGLHAPG